MSAADPAILANALAWLAAGRKIALATVIETWGSSPQPVGSKLLADADGNFLGSVSGGCVEAAVVAEAIEAIAQGKPRVLAYGVEDKTAWGVGLACGGRIRVLVAPIETDRGVLSDVLSDLAARRKVALLTKISTGAQSIVHAPEEADGDLAASIAAGFRSDKSKLVATPSGETFIDIFNPPLRLIIVGAVHIAQSLEPLAEGLGYQVTIIDPREAFAADARFDGATLLREWPDEAMPRLGVDAGTALVALSHDPRLDDPALLHALRNDALYVGGLGSKKTHAARVERLLAEGLSPDDLARIHAPIGLDIGAQGPAEIALSIIAEIVKVKRGGEGRGR